MMATMVFWLQEPLVLVIPLIQKLLVKVQECFIILIKLHFELVLLYQVNGMMSILETNHLLEGEEPLLQELTLQPLDLEQQLLELPQ